MASNACARAKIRNRASLNDSISVCLTIPCVDGYSERLFATIIAGDATPEDAETFRGQMLTEMARMSLDDGLVMQIHPGSLRNHNPTVYARFCRDMGADIPAPTASVLDLLSRTRSRMICNVQKL